MSERVFVCIGVWMALKWCFVGRRSFYPKPRNGRKKFHSKTTTTKRNVSSTIRWKFSVHIKRQAIPYKDRESRSGWGWFVAWASTRHFQFYRTLVGMSNKGKLMNSYEIDSCQIDLSLGKLNFSLHIRMNVFDVLIYGHFPSVQLYVLPPRRCSGWCLS